MTLIKKILRRIKLFIIEIDRDGFVLALLAIVRAIINHVYNISIYIFFFKLYTIYNLIKI